MSKQNVIDAVGWVSLDGPCNFRDVGGYPIGLSGDGAEVGSGAVYRSDGLHSMTDADFDFVQDRLGVSTVIDLRSVEEVDRDGIGRLAGSGIVRHHVPIIDLTRTTFSDPSLRLAALYARMIDEGATQFVAALEVIAATDRPIVFHCAAGKDRTGILAALTLGLLGVGDAAICCDYARTERVGARLRSWFDERVADPRFAGHFGDLDPCQLDVFATELLSARPETMAELLHCLRVRHGGIEVWARRNGLASRDLDRLRSRLVAQTAERDSRKNARSTER